MQTTLRMKARVLPGKRIEITAPEFTENTDVDLFVVLPEAEKSAEPPAFASAWDYLQSLPPIHRTPEEWAEVERELKEEKEAWDR